MPVKKIKEKDARTQKATPHSNVGPSLRCLVPKSKQEFLIVPGPKSDQFTLWEKLASGYRELSIGDNPNELSAIIEWHP